VQVARQCAREAAALVRMAYRVGRQDLGYKGRGDIVTATDLAVEARIHEIIEAAYPDHRILSEETRSETDTEGWVWVVDPIDGTTNFFQGIPFFCINIALCLDGEPMLGLTYDPLQREEFLAVKGRGLLVDGKEASASTKRFADSTVVFDFGGSPDARPGLEAFHELAWEVLHARVLGSSALTLAYAACGRIDFFVFAGGRPWDIAAGIALVRKGGGEVSALFGDPIALTSRGILAGSKRAHADFLARVKDEPWFQP
jgi:fructose-1,6-bisphosphatase/inositol monophosphatase family enzyme